MKNKIRILGFMIIFFTILVSVKTYADVSANRDKCLPRSKSPSSLHMLAPSYVYMPDSVASGATVNVEVCWFFVDNPIEYHTGSIYYANAFGDWEPYTPLATFYSTTAGSPRKVVANFSFTAPNKSGIYCVRFFWIAYYYPIHSFFGGTQDLPDEPPHNWVEKWLIVGTPQVAVSENPDGETPVAFELSQNYPNPFNPATKIEYSLERQGRVKILIYNTLGQLVRSLTDEIEPAGNHSANWDGTDDQGEKVASGVYFYQLKMDDFTSSKKMILLK